MMRQLEPGQINAIRALREAYPDAQIALIGAGALALHVDLKWRTTSDLDFVVTIAFADVEGTLRGREGWLQQGSHEHRWKAPNGVLLDIVPTPPAALEVRKLTWPSGDEMNLDGIRLALSEAPTEVAPGLSISIASVPALLVLKMAAHLDRPEREKDRSDLENILNEYPPITDDRFFEEDILALGLDERELRAFILGRELAARIDAVERALVMHFVDKVWRGGGSPVLRTGPWGWRAHEFDQTVDAFVRGLETRGR